IEALYYLCAPLFKRLSATPVIPYLMTASCLFFIAWPFIRNEYIAARYSYELAAFGMLWAWLAGWIAYERPRSIAFLATLIVGGLLSLWSQAKFFAIVDLVSGAANCVAWVGILVVVFFRSGHFDGKIAGMLDYLGELSFPLYLLH